MCKGIILCGGAGTRMFPITKGVSKQLLPLYDKPMVYYPLSVLMLAGIRDILVITTPEDAASFKRLLGDGSDYGINLQYAIQEKPEGIAQAFLIGEEFIGDSDVALVLGDNVFHGPGFSTQLFEAVSDAEFGKWATVFGYYVNDPERYGVVGWDENGKITSITPLSVVNVKNPYKIEKNTAKRGINISVLKIEYTQDIPNLLTKATVNFCFERVAI